MTLSNADKLRFAEVEDRITREFGDSDTMDFLEYLKQQDVENDLRQDSLEESIEFLVNECGELQKEVNEYRQQEETKLTEQLDLTQLTNRIQGWAVDRNLHTADHVKQALKLGEEFGELCQGIVKGNEFHQLGLFDLVQRFKRVKLTIVHPSFRFQNVNHIFVLCVLDFQITVSVIYQKS